MLHHGGFSSTDSGVPTTDDVVITVTTPKTTPTVNTWPTAATIVQGQALSSATLTGGSASVAGSFSYDSPSTTPAVGTNPAAVTFTPTDTTTYNTVAGSVNVTALTVFNGWAGGADKVFSNDANNDGVADGIAWLLGAITPGPNATALLPPATVSSGNLVMDFKCLKVSMRGSAILKLEYSKDLGVTDAWTSHTFTVPETTPIDPPSNPLTDVTFTITPIGTTNFNQVQATVPAGAAVSGGKVFVRLTGTIP